MTQKKITSQCLSTKGKFYQHLAAGCVDFRHWNVTRSSSSLISLFSRWNIFLLSCCTSKQSSALILQPSKPCSETSSMCLTSSFPLIYFSFFLFLFFISMSQLWKGLEHILMQFCLSVSRLFKLFIFWGIAFTELCSNSNRIIYYDKWHCEIVLFLQIVFFSLCFILCLCLSSPPQQQHCMWLMKGCFENSLSSSVNWPDCQEVGV